MGSIKDRNGLDLQKQKILEEVARIHRRIVKKRIFTTQIIMMV